MDVDAYTLICSSVTWPDVATWESERIYPAIDAINVDPDPGIKRPDTRKEMISAGGRD
jgi:hypothetical protein